MSTMVPMYGFGGCGGTGASLTVNAPAGATVTVSKDGKTKTKTAGADGLAVFKGLKSGQWTVTITDGEQTAQKAVTITADYSTAISFFSATIHVIYPAGSTCTATDGVTTLTAPNTSGSWDCVVPNAGTWTVTVIEKKWSASVEITENGQEASVDVSKYWIYKEGNQYEDLTGGWSFKQIGTTSTSYQSSIDSDSITVGASGSGKDSDRTYGVATGAAIDLTNASTLNIVVTSATISGSGGLRFGIDDTVDSGTWSGATAKASISTSTEKKTVSLDVSSITGSYYVWAGALSKAGSAYAKLTFTEIYLS